MPPKQFQALVVSEEADKTFSRQLTSRSTADLPDYDVLIAVKYSSLNYKDALSASGNKGVTRRYPHTPGVDVAGVVEESRSPLFSSGDNVIVTSYDLGTKIPGGFGQYVKVPADWIVPCPAGLSLHESMIFGTAGFTAAQSVLKVIEHGVKPEDGRILVTGATGGVGSVSVSLLAHLGYRVTGVTGKVEEHAMLKRLGAESVIGRDEATDTSGRLLLKEKWAAVIDTVGGIILETGIRTTKYGGIVTCCGNVASPDLSTSVYPFILRGVSLAGIDSAACPMETRIKVWNKLAGEWKISLLGELAVDIKLSQLNSYIDMILKGKTKGRVVLDLNG
ncbi:MAG: YhdH/YhfP family quinone oxidoreductase [Desulfobulbaceae bacterium]|uniref:YhdH/YhfP family quinone oxidoreductase n=1 Tax=Candidatus Desulfobia pelagia TaxID=2841692 RepID=A0A8J6TBC4_9BACT|nr:YhdH/YhfP family quinone oxidoreductase [Candidatus Desulfobia pelagia]